MCTNHQKLSNAIKDTETRINEIYIVLKNEDTVSKMLIKAQVKIQIQQNKSSILLFMEFAKLTTLHNKLQNNQAKSEKQIKKRDICHNMY